MISLNTGAALSYSKIERNSTHTHVFCNSRELVILDAGVENIKQLFKVSNLE